MDILRMMVKSILAIIIVAALLDIIVPRGDMKRYINLIIGLFVIVAMLNPILGIIHQGFSFDVLNTATAPNSDTAAIIQKGQELSNRQQTQAVSQYKEKLSRQISSLAGMFPGTRVSRVGVDMIEDTADPRFGQVIRIILYTGEGGNRKTQTQGQSGTQADDIRVEEININPAVPGPKTAKPAGPADDLSGLKQMIADFYGLTAEQVVVEK